MNAAGSSCRLRWLGHATVLVDVRGVRVVTDPLLRMRIGHLHRTAPLAGVPITVADVVLVSHVHHDHLDPTSIARVGGGPALVVPAGARRSLRRLRRREIVEVREGDCVEVRGVRVRATHAQHAATRYPGGRSVPSLGYVLESPAGGVYFAGDTDLFDAMADLRPGLAVALLPIAGWGPRIPSGHMDPERAAGALQLLRPRIAVPIHWGTYRPFYQRASPPDHAAEFARLAAALAPGTDVRVLPVGGTLELDPDGGMPAGRPAGIVTPARTGRALPADDRGGTDERCNSDLLP